MEKNGNCLVLVIVKLFRETFMNDSVEISTELADGNYSLEC